MTIWAWPAIVFGAVLFTATAVRRRYGLALGFAGYAIGAALLSGVASGPVRFAAPLAALVIGYWLTKPFYTSPSPRLETWLLRYDEAMQIDRISAGMPGWAKALVEIAYLGAYPFMVVAAIPAFAASRDAFAWHWAMVLAAELSCYVTLPWLQARPPRENGDRPHFFAKRKNGVCPHFLRRLNEALLDRLSVRATTIPSGHVAGPIAAALSIWMIAPAWGPWLLAGALAIAAATVIGRYHYAIDAVLGLAVGAAPPAIRWFWT
ncbi:MAG TPA: phosphatase PAP2 family protein [Vicinamibacterales bacterium]|nr:phosphatase PAP2 family protein [Vicinamibacterales bacterium]